MTVMHAVDDIFDMEFGIYECSRMYPPGYRKESPMIKLSMKHVNAVCHAEFLLDAATTKVPIPKMRAQLEDDLLRLAELKLHIIELMTDKPQLFPEKGKSDGNAGT